MKSAPKTPRAHCAPEDVTARALATLRKSAAAKGPDPDREERIARYARLAERFAPARPKRSSSPPLVPLPKRTERHEPPPLAEIAPARAARIILAAIGEIRPEHAEWLAGLVVDMQRGLCSPHPQTRLEWLRACAALRNALNTPNGKDRHMLAITRCVDQIILIGDDVQIKVLRIRDREVRLGITAPPAVSIFRLELLERIRQENPEQVVRSLARLPDPDARIKRFARELGGAA